MTELFTITYTQPSNNNTATLKRQCEASTLGEGLKDICLYLRNTPHSVQPIPSGEAVLSIIWQKDASANDYKWMTAEDMKQKIETMKSILLQANNIDHRAHVNNFIINDLIQQMDNILLSLSENGKQTTIKQYKSQIKYIFNKISARLLPQNNLTVDFRGFVPTQIQEIMSTLYKQIPDSDKKKFKYKIDFDSLTAEPK